MTNDHESAPDNRRRSARETPGAIVPVVDGLTGERMGQIGNLSAEGLMLIAQNHIEQGSLFQMEFTLTDLGEKEHTFNVGALCLWCSVANSRSTFWAGFEIMDISERDAATLRDIVVHL
jgi:hypothetical protein